MCTDILKYMEGCDTCQRVNTNYWKASVRDDFYKTLSRLLQSSHSKSHSINHRKLYNKNKRCLMRVVSLCEKVRVKDYIVVTKDQLKTRGYKR
jgi:hypothetical protein